MNIFLKHLKVTMIIKNDYLLSKTDPIDITTLFIFDVVSKSKSPSESVLTSNIYENKRIEYCFLTKI